MSNTTATVKERPIIFSAPMVRAILEGRKTQTRRIIKPQPPKDYAFPQECIGDGFWWNDGEEDLDDVLFWPSYEKCLPCPYGSVGERLWVRETFWCENDTDSNGYTTIDCGSMLSLGASAARVDYCTNGECKTPPEIIGNQKVDEWNDKPMPGYWWLSPPDNYDGESDYTDCGTWCFLPWTFFTKHPSIHMPRWASRITLEIIGVRVERLNDISTQDMISEGYPGPKVDGKRIGWSEFGWFSSLWESINGEGSWSVNPWVWVVEFKRSEGK